MREDRREKLIQAKKNQDAEIKQMEDNINKFRASATKASFAQSLIKKLDKIERIEVDNEDVSKFNIRFCTIYGSGESNLRSHQSWKSLWTEADF